MADRDKFDSITLPYLDTVYRAAVALCGRVDNAQDLVQETYLKALKRFESFRPGTNCRAWLLRILRNTWIDQLRHLKIAGPEVPIEESLVAANPSQQETLWSDANDILENFSDGHLIKALSELSEERRLTLFLVDVEGFSHEEVAEIMDVPVGTVKSRTSRARAALKQRLLGHARRLGFMRRN
jgi:RNA polymerase sigma-70 factor (ECF subfamily)